MIHIFQELKVVSENFCLFLGFVQNLFRVCRHQSPTVFFFSNSNQTPLADSFHFSILPKSQSSTSFSMCLCFRCSRISFPYQTFLHLDHHLDLCSDVVGFEICLHLLGKYWAAQSNWVMQAEADASRHSPISHRRIALPSLQKQSTGA